MIGVYKILNVKNKKAYIGSSGDVLKRWRFHKNDLKNNSHHNYKLQKDYNRFGLGFFEFILLELCEKEELLLIEQKHIDIICLKKHKLYNITQSAEFSKPSEFIKNCISTKNCREKNIKYKYSELAEVPVNLIKNILSKQRNIASRTYGVSPRCYALLKMKYAKNRIWAL